MIVYHLRPGRLPGGFIGVDVFFVISGFLIIGSLTRELERVGRISLVDFYGRRIRRLLPAATLVIVSTVIGSLLLLPVSQWKKVMTGALTSALQFQNWALAFGDDEYAQATAGVSPFQHFWSLAVEEQFYVVVPLAMVGAAIFARAMRLAVRRTVFLLLGVVVVVSLSWSVYYTAARPDAAYFVTTTRAWELAIGGLTALIVTRISWSRALRTIVGVLGLVAVLGSALTFNTSMGFPGWVALVPTLGTVAIVLAGSTLGDQAVVPRLLSTAPVVWVGDISYSLYLWHWPFIVFALALTETSHLTLVDAALVLLASVLAATLSTYYVEAPFRRQSSKVADRSSRSVRARPFVLGTVLMTTSVVVAAAPLAYIAQRTSDAPVAIDALHPGAAVFDGASEFKTAPLAPDPIVAKGDVALVNRDGCIEVDITLSDAVGEACRYGQPDSVGSIMLVGDSHAGVLSTPLELIAKRNGMNMTALVRNGCPFNVVPMHSGGVPFADCAERNERNRDMILEERPTLVVVTGMTSYGYDEALNWDWESFDAAVEGYRATLRPLVDAGVPVVAVRDTPYMPFSVPDCVSEHGRDSSECDMRRDALERQADPLIAAVEGMQGAHIVDLTDGLCGANVCRSVEGNVLVYRDNHLTDTYAKSLTSRLEAGLGL
ncbi:hypothetical protein ASE27_03875 [Oerskovia sp. Root918]|nr:hypothetical protein ASE27_03875 [Oerskovia sp. Root918]